MAPRVYDAEVEGERREAVRLRLKDPFRREADSHFRQLSLHRRNVLKSIKGIIQAIDFDAKNVPTIVAVKYHH
jgi:hypothetical protein